MVNVNYKSLNFYNKAYEFTLEVYKITKEFPKEETYGVTSQLRRAASSIPANIVEGSGRSTIKDYKNFLHNALGSAKECEIFLKLSKDLGYIFVSTFDRLQEMLNQIIGSLINYIKTINENQESNSK